MYWTDWGPVAKIERISMCGDLTTRQLVFSKNHSWPNGLAIDFTISRLFWVDARRETLESSNLDGSSHTIVLKVIGQHPFSVTIFEDHAYWTDWATETVNRANKFNGKFKDILQTGLHKPMGIAVYHAILQPAGIVRNTLKATFLFAYVVSNNYFKLLLCFILRDSY